ncbi:MAG: GBS Bsp-like repeat-containing protein [Clostridium sp.]|nr:GBS Bsp-like repeat-containing protein [Clostridium sp.]MCM1171267.1 GBS Bsp-like repeat-containing protein [Clostridium sp.]MCM1207463.1 GBS Bsp-like repeat-containing protein [Ruminococcus sp.]
MRKGKNNLKRRISKFLVATMTLGVMAGCNVGVLTPKAATTAQNLVGVASAEVGYHEKASNSNLDDKTANSGSADYTKYARDLGVANGNAWCAYFVWWCMKKAGVPTDQYAQTGWVPSITSFYSARGKYRARGTYTPKPGDVIIFGDSDHVGIVESADGYTVNTIEGNSSNQVARRSYSASSTYIMGYGIVNYVSDTKGPEITDIKVISQTSDSYTVQCKVKDDYGVAFVTFPTWTQKNDQDDLEKYWYDSRSKSVGKLQGDTATFTVYKKDHNNEEGVYITHVYASDKNGNMACGGGVSVVLDSSAPTISDAGTSDVSTDGYKVIFKAKDQYTKIKAAYCIPYTTEGGQDDVPSDWQQKSQYMAKLDGDRYIYEMKVSDFGNVRGAYQTKIVVFDECGNRAELDMHEVVIPEPIIDNHDKDDEQQETASNTEEATDGAVEENNSDDMENTDEQVNIEESTGTEEQTNTEKPAGTEEQTNTEELADTGEQTNTEEPIDVEEGVANNNTEQPSNEVNTDISVNVDNSTTNNNLINNISNTTDNTTNNVTNNTTNTTNNTSSNTTNNITNVYSVPEAASPASTETAIPVTTSHSNGQVTEPSATPIINTNSIVPEEGVTYTVESMTEGQMFDNQLYDILLYLYNVALSMYIPEGYEVTSWNGETTDGVLDTLSLEEIKESGVGISIDTKIGGEDVKINISFK